MSDDLEVLRQDVVSELAAATDLRAWDAVRVATLGKSGRLTGLLKALGKMPPDERKTRGVALNRLRDTLTQAVEARGRELEAAALQARLVAARVDVSLPPPATAQGYLHP
ncbi:MAG: phenylalanine--tRNA ligase subunit alpha, partial [Acetobacter sp.]